ncbi:MAG: S46 family peptidase, partial [Planctomycetota bacterium]
LAAAKNRKTSRFFDDRIGDVPVCFLSDGDTTGGNSGSPVINGKGELVGLNFDRVFEAVAGDFGWNPDRSRNISVDMRYVLWILEQVQPAPHLLKEMGL